MSVQRENIADKNDKNDDATNQVVDNMENYEEGDIHQSFQVLSEMYVRRTYISVACLGAPFLFVTKCLLRNTLACIRLYYKPFLAACTALVIT